MSQLFEYFVLDGRAEFDMESASVYQVLGRKIPSSKQLSRDWGDMGAILARAPVVNNLNGDTTECGEFEIVHHIE